MSWEGFGLKAVEVEGDSKMFEVQLPATIPNCRGLRSSDGMIENNAIFCRRFLSPSAR